MNHASESTGPAFDVERLLYSLASLPVPPRYWIGFSGGADSTALLLAMHEARQGLPAPFCALHFHHGLQPEADDWLVHCRDFCEHRGIPFENERLAIDVAAGSSPETAARDQRYRAVARRLGRDEMYLTAHQAEDQAETLFLNLMRGSGIEGLAGIPALRRLERGWVARPLLDVHREELVGYLRNRDVDWLTDPSNADTRFDRNFLRQELFPLLEMRWPGLVRRLSRTARNVRASASAMAAFIEQTCGDLVSDELTMPLPGLLELQPDMQALILRQWLRRHELPALPELRLLEFLKQLRDAGEASQVEVRWSDWTIRRYRERLWMKRPGATASCRDTTWEAGDEIFLGSASGRLELRGAPVEIPPDWRLRSRRPGDRLRPRAGEPSRSLKQLFQDAGVPPWLRPGVPILQWGGETVALGDWVLAPRLQDWLQRHGLEYRWQPDDPALERIRRDNHNGRNTP